VELLGLLKLLPVLIAALLVGNWFLAEVKKARRLRKPWYAPYLTVPGVLILAVLLFPIVYHFYKQ
jgi:hypothetical protein